MEESSKYLENAPLLSEQDFELSEVVWGRPRQRSSLIYFLLNRGRVVYVGQTKNGVSRPLSHIGKKIFDEIRVIDVPYKNLDIEEDRYIRKYLPFYNKQINYPANLSFNSFVEKISKLGRTKISRVEAWAIIRAAGLQVLRTEQGRYLSKYDVDNMLECLGAELEDENLEYGENFVWGVIELYESIMFGCDDGEVELVKNYLGKL